MTHITCRLTAKNRDQLRNPTVIECGLYLFNYAIQYESRVKMVNSWRSIGKMRNFIFVRSVPVLHYEGCLRALAQERFSIALAAVCTFSEFVSVAFVCFCAFKPNAFCAAMRRRAQQISYYTSYLGVKLHVSGITYGTKVHRYNWHSAGSLGWPFPVPKY